MVFLAFLALLENFLVLAFNSGYEFDAPHSGPRA